MINSTQAEILRDVGRTIVHMATLDGATTKGAREMIDVMIRALDVGRHSKSSSTYKFPASTVQESANLITDKDVYGDIGVKPAEIPILSAQSCGRNVATVQMISSALIIAKGASRGQKGSRVGNVANSLQIIRGRARELLLRTVIIMFQGRQRLLRQLHFTRKLPRRPPLRLRRHQRRLPRRDCLASVPPRRPPLQLRRHQCFRFLRCLNRWTFSGLECRLPRAGGSSCSAS